MGTYYQISQDAAKKRMDTSRVCILDVRELGEFSAGHIPGAQLLPFGEINASTAAAVIPEKNATVLVYCRSGRRSKIAAEKLVSLGYTEVYEFGGILTWPYDIVE